MPLRAICRRVSSITLADVVKIAVMVLCVSSLVAEFVRWVRVP